MSFHLGRPTFAFWCTELKSNGMVLFKVVFGYSSCRQSLPSFPPERLNTAQPGHESCVRRHTMILERINVTKTSWIASAFWIMTGFLVGLVCLQMSAEKYQNSISTLLDSTMVGFLQSAQQCLHFLVFALFGLIGEPLIAMFLQQKQLSNSSLLMWTEGVPWLKLS